MPEQPTSAAPAYDPAQPGRDQISLSGLTRGEAREFNRFFLISFTIFTAIALVAHYLVWIWRPWLQNTAAPVRTSLLDAIHPFISLIG